MAIRQLRRVQYNLPRQVLFVHGSSTSLYGLNNCAPPRADTFKARQLSPYKAGQKPIVRRLYDSLQSPKFKCPYHSSLPLLLHAADHFLSYLLVDPQQDSRYNFERLFEIRDDILDILNPCRNLH